MSDQEKREQGRQLLELVQEVIAQDQALRDANKVGDKFRFIRDRLNLLRNKIEEAITVLHKEVTDQAEKSIVAEDEVLIYVHLFNAQGIVLQTWQKLLLPTVFYEYSVNRPIYPEKSHIESFLRSKTNKVQHGYLTIAIKKVNIITVEGLKDAVGGPVIKVKDGSLNPKRLIAFTHNHLDYVVSETGELVKKE